MARCKAGRSFRIAGCYNLVELFLAPPAQYDGRALACEAANSGGADAGASARHHHYFSCEAPYLGPVRHRQADCGTTPPTKPVGPPGMSSCARLIFASLL